MALKLNFLPISLRRLKKLDVDFEKTLGLDHNCF